MPSFDIVSQVDPHELTNAVDQANRELQNRFDFRQVDASFALLEGKVKLKAPNEFQLSQLFEIFQSKCIKRGIDVRCLNALSAHVHLGSCWQEIAIKQGIDKEFAKTINRLIKDKQFKVQSSIQGDQIRVNGKKRDDLQEVIAYLKKAELEQPLQFENFRD